MIPKQITRPCLGGDVFVESHKNLISPCSVFDAHTWMNATLGPVTCFRPRSSPILNSNMIRNCQVITGGLFDTSCLLKPVRWAFVVTVSDVFSFAVWFNIRWQVRQIYVYKGGDKQKRKQWIDLRVTWQETLLSDGLTNHWVKRWEGLKVQPVHGSSHSVTPETLNNELI